MVGRPVVFALGGGLRRIYLHPTHDIGFHGAPPLVAQIPSSLSRQATLQAEERVNTRSIWLRLHPEVSAGHGLPPDQPPLKRRRSAEALAKAEGGSHELVIPEATSRQFDSAYNSARRSLSALAMTDTELSVMAALAQIGLINTPRNGYKMPAATGTPSAL
jgi:hypothetical protein